MVLRSTFNTMVSYKKLYYPLVVLAFIQLLCLELLYFSPRFPLAAFFGPIIRNIWGEKYLHYPLNLVLLPKLFYYAQLVIYLFVGSFLLAVLSRLVVTYNNEGKVDVRKALRSCWPLYVHVLLATFLTFGIFHLLSMAYGMIIQRAFEIRSTAGIFFWIKQLVIQGAPYVQFIASILVTTLFVYVVPIIMVHQKKIASALIENFKVLGSSMWLSLVIVLIPSLFYIPILILRNHVGFLASLSGPEIQILVIVLSAIITIAVNAFIMAAATIFYLYKKES